jgi:uncharacterized protein (DUF1330 family)
MSYYFLAQIKINDEDGYQKYIAGSREVFSKYNGEYLAVDNNPKITEGYWDYTRVVLIKFETEADFNEWYHSADYQEILIHRLNAADCDSLLIKGIT